ncbi:MAG: hypothetical protein LBG13_03300 [Holosporales bacterium]|nr:hypothetical protein [Holosporales bacterium]
MNKKLFVLGSLILCSLGVLGAPGAQAMNNVRHSALANAIVFDKLPSKGRRVDSEGEVMDRWYEINPVLDPNSGLLKISWWELNEKNGKSIMIGEYGYNVVPNSQKFWRIAGNMPEQEKPALVEFMNKLAVKVSNVYPSWICINPDADFYEKGAAVMFPVVALITEYINDGKTEEVKRQRAMLVQALGFKINPYNLNDREWSNEIQRLGYASEAVLAVYVITNFGKGYKQRI